MANVFAILTAIVLAISAFLAYQNMGREIEEGRGYRGWLTKTKNEKDALARKQDQLKKTVDTLEATKTELADYNGRNEILDAEVTAQKETNDELKAQVAAKEAEASVKAAEVAAKKESIEEFGEVDEVLATLNQVQRELAQIELDIAQREAQQASLESQRSGVDKSLANLRKRINWRVTGESDPNLSTRIGRVFPSHGFVTLAGGDNLGIVKDSPLEVVRDGEVIAKLLVSTVEATTSAADIVPESVVEGENLRAGDRVRAPKGAPAPEPAPAPAAAPAPAPAPEPAPAEPGLPEPTDPAPDPEPDAEPGAEPGAEPDAEPDAESDAEPDPFG